MSEGSTRTNGEFELQDPKQLKCLQDKGKPNKTTTGLISYIDPFSWGHKPPIPPFQHHNLSGNGPECCWCPHFQLRIVVPDALCHSRNYCQILKFRRVTIRGAQPSVRLSEEICLSERSAGVSQRALRGLSEGSAGSLQGFSGVRGIFRGFSGVVTLCL